MGPPSWPCDWGNAAGAWALLRSDEQLIHLVLTDTLLQLSSATEITVQLFPTSLRACCICHELSKAGILKHPPHEVLEQRYLGGTPPLLCFRQFALLRLIWTVCSQLHQLMHRGKVVLSDYESFCKTRCSTNAAMLFKAACGSCMQHPRLFAARGSCLVMT